VLPSKPKSRASKNKPFVIAGVLIAVIIVGAIAIVVISKSVNQDIKKVAVASVQTEVQQILGDRTTGYNSDDIKDVKCNNGQDPTAKKGQSFSCDVTVRGKPHQLTVTFLDSAGTYEVGLPQLAGGK
jgi:type II secretory pathway pseudopilin PulG